MCTSDAQSDTTGQTTEFTMGYDEGERIRHEIEIKFYILRQNLRHASMILEII